MIPGFGKIHSRCDGGWHKSIQAISERLELWGYSPEEAYRVASLTEEQEKDLDEMAKRFKDTKGAK